MQPTFNDYVYSNKIAIESVSLPEAYSGYLSWLKSYAVDFSPAAILFQLKIINDLVIYNLSTAEKTKTKRDQILNQQDPTLISGLRAKFSAVFPGPDYRQTMINELKSVALMLSIGAMICIASIFVPTFLTVATFTVGFGLMYNPFGTAFLSSYKHIDVKHSDTPTRWYTAAALIGLGAIIALEYTQIVPAILVVPVLLPLSLISILSISILAASYVHEHLNKLEQALMKQEPDLSRELTDLISPELEMRTPELQEAVSATTSCFLLSPSRHCLMNGQNIQARVLLNDYNRIRPR